MIRVVNAESQRSQVASEVHAPQCAPRLQADIRAQHSCRHSSCIQDCQSLGERYRKYYYSSVAVGETDSGFDERTVT